MMMDWVSPACGGWDGAADTGPAPMNATAATASAAMATRDLNTVNNLSSLFLTGVRTAGVFTPAASATEYGADDVSSLAGTTALAL